MDAQTLLNILLGGGGAVCGWIINNLWKRVDNLAAADTLLVDKVNAIEVLVAGNYVKKDELERYMTAMFNKLDKIYDKLDAKVDKSDKHSYTHNHNRCGDTDEL
jgi:hypothetical protein